MFRFLAFLWCVLLGGVELSAQANPCLGDTAFHIVVLGSSTAAGSGASPSDSAWVNRYRAELQAINPNNLVTNRAQGGFTTYQLMPDNFVPPGGRPNPNLTRNITYALSLNPSAIIVNLPSNDVSSGFSVQEQLDNFDTMVAHATNAGVPIWICTTQPKNYGGNMTNIQKQLDVRDSIFARYSPFVLDFWNGLESNTNELNPFYDSGDGTHLNNTGHAFLHQRASDAQILDVLYVPVSYTDYVPSNFREVFHPICGDANAIFRLDVHNRGAVSANVLNVSVEIENLNTNVFQNMLLNGNNTLAACVKDSLDVTFSTLEAGDYRIEMVIASAGDANAMNDTLIAFVSSFGMPILVLSGDTGCVGESLNLTATTGFNDSIRWYDAGSGGTLLGTGSNFPTPTLNASTLFYAEAARGDFVYYNDLKTSATSNINFNGTMFDVVADSSLVIDSLELKIVTTGPQVVEVYSKSGSHLGFEAVSGAWTLFGSFNVNVTDPNVPVVFGTGDFPISMGDTIGFYLQLESAGASLSYQSVSNPVIRQTDEMTIITGSGSSHNFGGSYYPRDFSGGIFYHYGSKPDGDCLSARIPVEAVIGDPQVNLGADTIIGLTHNITLDPGAGFDSYLWSDGSTSQTLFVDGNVLGTGVFTYWVTITDALGCPATDSIIVVFAPLAGMDGESLSKLHFWPNPTSEQLHFDLPTGTYEYRITDITGREVVSGTLNGNQLDVKKLKSAYYSILIRSKADLEVVLQSVFYKQE